MIFNKKGNTDVSESISMVYSSGDGAFAEIDTSFIAVVRIFAGSCGDIVILVLLVIKESSSSVCIS
jgi:hypothetical protein